MNRAATVTAAVVLVGVLAGCWVTGTSSSGLGYPAGPGLDEFDLRQRCGDQDASCSDRALEIIRQLLEDLGPRIEDPAAQPPMEGQPEGLLVITASSDPPFDFRAADGTAGATLDVSADLTPSLSGEGAPYVVMDAGAFEIDPDGATALLDALFVPVD